MAPEVTPVKAWTVACSGTCGDEREFHVVLATERGTACDCPQYVQRKGFCRHRRAVLAFEGSRQSFDERLAASGSPLAAWR